jgi:hypothetical protein
VGLRLRGTVGVGGVFEVLEEDWVGIELCTDVVDVTGGRLGSRTGQREPRTTGRDESVSRDMFCVSKGVRRISNEQEPQYEHVRMCGCRPTSPLW